MIYNRFTVLVDSAPEGFAVQFQLLEPCLELLEATFTNHWGAHLSVRDGNIKKFFNILLCSFNLSFFSWWGNWIFFPLSYIIFSVCLMSDMFVGCHDTHVPKSGPSRMASVISIMFFPSHACKLHQCASFQPLPLLLEEQEPFSNVFMFSRECLRMH